jgi:hypothetical protein
VALHKLADLAEQGDKRANLARKHYGNKYDEYYMQRTPIDDDLEDEEEYIVVDEDAAGLRRRVNIVSVSVGFVRTTVLTSECDVIVINGEVFVAGEEEYLMKFAPV